MDTRCADRTAVVTPKLWRLTFYNKQQLPHTHGVHTHGQILQHHPRSFPVRMLFLCSDSMLTVCDSAGRLQPAFFIIWASLFNSQVTARGSVAHCLVLNSQWWKATVQVKLLEHSTVGVEKSQRLRPVIFYIFIIVKKIP